MSMKRTLLAFALAAGTSLPLAAQQPRQTQDAFNWSGKVPAGGWIRVVNLNGPITVGTATGDNVVITATKQWRRGDPAVVRFETRKFGPGGESALVCALWGERADCDERGNYESRNDRGQRNNDVSVSFRVLVPKGVKVGVHTINGAVTVDGVSSDVEAETVNGEVDVATSGGQVNASNVNGGVRARLGTLAPDGRMKFETVNGSVSVEFAGDSGADVELETVNGTINTNFEMAVSGRMDPKHLRAHVGRPGGPRISLETVNGSVELKRRP
jgi:hypothetical protein